MSLNIYKLFETESIFKNLRQNYSKLTYKGFNISFPSAKELWIKKKKKKGFGPFFVQPM